MPHPDDNQLLLLLRGLQKGDHVAWFWGQPGAPDSVLLYLRVSSRQQLDGAGLTDQYEACVAHAQRMGWVIAGLYVDPAISGTKEHRPAIDQLKRDVRRYRTTRVLFYRVNRIGRNVRASYATADEVESSGAEVVSATETFNRTTAAGRLTFGMLAVMAEYGSNQLKEVMQTTLAGKARSGLWVGPVPLGYERDGRSLRPSANAPIIEQVFTFYANGRHSYTSIADLLNEQGYQTLDWRTGERGLFGRESIRTILRNRAYLGYVSSGGKEYQGSHPPLITEDLWAQATAVREGRTEQGGVVKVKAVCPGLLVELIHCAECGAKMWHHWSNTHGGRRRYYR
jgi:site-specific DNA recombinase